MEESWRTHSLRQSRTKLCLERSEMKSCDIGIGDEDVCRRREGIEHGVDDVRDEVEPAVNGFLPEDRHLQNIWVHDRGEVPRDRLRLSVIDSLTRRPNDREIAEVSGSPLGAHHSQPDRPFNLPPWNDPQEMSLHPLRPKRLQIMDVRS